MFCTNIRSLTPASSSVFHTRVQPYIFLHFYFCSLPSFIFISATAGPTRVESGPNTEWLVIFVIGESRTRGDCFRSRPCAAVWIVRLCLRSILDYFSDSRERRTRWHAFVGCCIEVGQGLKRGSFALHVGNKIFAVLIFARMALDSRKTRK